MSYDIRLAVKVDGTDIYAEIAEPEYSSPTYNLRAMFVACMDWDYTQGNYYKCEDVLNKVERGIRELTCKPYIYNQYNPPNGWGSRESAIESLEGLRACILEQAEYIPIEHLYMCW